MPLQELTWRPQENCCRPCGAGRNPRRSGHPRRRRSTPAGAPMSTGTRTPGVFAQPGALPAEIDFTIDELGSLRGFVTAATASMPLDGERGSEFGGAVNELAPNSICHGGGHGTLRLW